MSQFKEPIVAIQDGNLKGTTGTNLDGEKFFKFFGIPYAKPPVNELRFKPPQPVLPWESIRDAIQSGSSSISRDENNILEIVGSEDCLFLNVYTKKLPSSNTLLRPVMVWIHGGGFTTGSNHPDLYGPEFLMIKDIVLVVINYRLGALGFLSVDGSEVTGNMGLKDQNLALKWVQKNIKCFNGDSNNVTIFGESAGAGSVHAHVLSPASKGLFHKAILQSGCALNPWFLGSKNMAKKITSHLGQTNCQTELDALEALKQFSGLDIFKAQDKCPDTLYPSLKRTFGCMVESKNETAIITKHPRDILKEGSYNRVPMMMGYTDTEGMLINLFAQNHTTTFEKKDAIPYELNVTKGTPEHTKLCNMLENLYSGTTNNYDIMTDACFLTGIIESLCGHLETGTNPIYLYRMSVESQMSRLKNAMKSLDPSWDDTSGVCHADDLGYLWNSSNAPEIKPKSLEDKFIRTFVELWTNFAEFGVPTPTNNNLNISWPPIKSKDQLNLLNIGEEVEVMEIPECNRVQVWRDIYDEWLPKTTEN